MIKRTPSENMDMLTDLRPVLAFVETTYFSQSVQELLFKSTEFFMSGYGLTNCSIILYDTHHRAITNGSLSEWYRAVEEYTTKVINNRKTAYFISKNSPDPVTQQLKKLDTNVAAYPIIARGEMIGTAFFYGNQMMQEHHRTITALLDKLSRVAMHVKGYTEVKHSAMCDPMTGLYNKAYFEDATKRSLEDAKSHQQPTSLVIIDLDNFKKYNDTKGHIAGDHLLKELANCIRRHAPKTYVTARFGGEEFVILLPKTSSQSGAQWAEFLRQKIEAEVDTTASIGVATCMKSKSKYSDVLKAADEAMYKSKKSGKNRVTQYILLDPSISPIVNAIAPNY